MVGPNSEQIIWRVIINHIETSPRVLDILESRFCGGLLNYVNIWARKRKKKNLTGAFRCPAVLLKHQSIMNSQFLRTNHCCIWIIKSYICSLFFILSIGNIANKILFFVDKRAKFVSQYWKENMIEAFLFFTISFVEWLSIIQ